MIGVGYRPRTGSIFFTRNGKKLDDVAHGLKAQNFFPTVGANGPCQVHVNFGQMGFVFIEANVKKWGLAPMTGSLAPPPPYGSEQGSILLEGGRDGVREGMAGYLQAGYQHGRTRSGSQQIRVTSRHPTSPGPQRSPTDISLAQLSLVDSISQEDLGEGTSRAAAALGISNIPSPHPGQQVLDYEGVDAPPEYQSPEISPDHSHDERQPSADAGREHSDGERRPLMHDQEGHSPPIPSYDDVVADYQTRGRSDTRNSRS